MKQTNKLPRRIGYSLLTSLNSMSTLLLNAHELTTSTYHDELKLQMIGRNNTIYTQKDIDALKSIKTFYADTIKGLETRKKMPEGSFVTIAKHSKPNLKYVSTPSAVGIVLTTAMLKRILELCTTVGYDVRGNTKAERSIEYVCEANCYTADNRSAEFLRLLDILRYFDEVDSMLIEISLEGVQNDWKIDQKSVSNYYSRYNNSTSESVGALYPMISDRYQDDSWRHYLSTLYNGLCTPDNVSAIATQLPMSVMMAELKGARV